MNNSNLTIEWTLKQARYELQLAKRDLSELIKSAQTLLAPADTKRTSFDRATRVAPITFAAGAGLFGLGPGRKSKIETILDLRWSQVQDRNNQRIFVLALMLTHLRRQQDEITNIQNDNNKQIEEPMKSLNANIHK